MKKMSYKGGHSYGPGMGKMSKDGGDRKPMPRDSKRKSHLMHEALRRQVMYPSELAAANDRLRESFNTGTEGGTGSSRRDVGQDRISHSHANVRGSVAPGRKK